MSKPVILVTGANGQLGRELRDLEQDYPGYAFIFLGREELPIQSADQVQRYFKEVQPAYCINCAAYTAVDKAETEREAAMLINGAAAGILAEACQLSGAKFIHISTDYVFDGMASSPYKEDHATRPVNYYGSTKLQGEELARQYNPASIVIRTSWVYSRYGNNFVKTMLRLMKERNSLNVVNDQLGSPTYAADLAAAILLIIDKKEKAGGEWVPGIYHFSNNGIISWYDFAVAIKRLSGSQCVVQGIPTAAYPTPARRPAYSVFDKTKIQTVYQLPIADWENRLAAALAVMPQ